VYFDLLRNCYEAFVINTLFCLLVEYCGGYKKTKEAFAEQETVKLLFPLSFISVKPKRGLLRTLKRITLQYVIINPLCALAAVILQSVNIYCQGNWNFSRGYLYITAILFISVTAAMYALIMFHSMMKKEMEQYKPLYKMLAVKFVIFLSFWQSIAVSGLLSINVIKATGGWSTNNLSNGIQNVLICGEMVLISFIHLYVFPYQPYVKDGFQTPLFSNLKHVFSPYDIAHDVISSFYPKSSKNKVLPTDMKNVELQENDTKKNNNESGEEENNNNSNSDNYSSSENKAPGTPTTIIAITPIIDDQKYAHVDEDKFSDEEL